MSGALRKLGQEYWTKTFLTMFNYVKLSRFCCLFTLRQGTILIAIIELSLTSFCLFLLLLGATHAQEIVELVASDLRQAKENKLLERASEESPVFLTNNEKKMLTGQHLASLITLIVLSGLVLTSIHFMSCILLLYGAIRTSPSYLLPWTTTSFLSQLTGFVFLMFLLFLPVGECKVETFAILIAFFIMETYSWIVVVSFYQELKTSQLKNFGPVTYRVCDAQKTAHVPQIPRIQNC